jgi:8-amino-7-oxononanoate synthase
VALTTGVPAALPEERGSFALAQELAELQSCERATLAASTLHLYFDLFGQFAQQPLRIYMDRDCYPISRWGVERAKAQGARVRVFPHNDAFAVARMVEEDKASDRMPVIVCDGFCPSCGATAPLSQYHSCVASRSGLVVVDDTQALGMLGEKPQKAAPYGKGGGGSLRFQGLPYANLLLCSSLAKAFGAPVAALSGPASLISQFETNSDTRIPCSPPSTVVLRAAQRALAENRLFGDNWREHLNHLMLRLRFRLREAGLKFVGAIFPFAMILGPRGANMKPVQDALSRQGVQTALVRGCSHVGAGLALVITALHDIADIDRVVHCLARAMREFAPKHSVMESTP